MDLITYSGKEETKTLNSYIPQIDTAEIGFVEEIANLTKNVPTSPNTSADSLWGILSWQCLCTFLMVKLRIKKDRVEGIVPNSLVNTGTIMTSYFLLFLAEMGTYILIIP